MNSLHFYLWFFDQKRGFTICPLDNFQKRVSSLFNTQSPGLVLRLGFWLSPTALRKVTQGVQWE
jgi:hypothetical protein